MTQQDTITIRSDDTIAYLNWKAKGYVTLWSGEGKIALRPSRLTLLLGRVKAREHEVTLDLDSYQQGDIDKVRSVVEAHGLDAAFDGRFMLVRDLREVVG